jgi:type IV pilus assembly protein PilM
VGGSVTAAPQFQSNHLSFAEAYGLCVQGLGMGQLDTNLLPHEIVTKRLVRAKKPWTVAAASVLLLGLTANYFSHYSTYASADVESPEMKSAMNTASGIASTATNLQSEHTTLTARFDELKEIRANLRSNDDGRLLWLELGKAIDAALPKDERSLADRKLTADDVRNREELHIESVDCEFFPDVAVWYTEVGQALKEAAGISVADVAATSAEEAEAEGEATDEAPAEGQDAELAQADVAAADELAEDALEEDFGAGIEGEGEGEEVGPSGEGWIIQLTGYHFHNSEIGSTDDFGVEAGQFVRRTLIKNLREGSVMLPDSQGNMVEVSMKDLGISYPVMVSNYRPVPVSYDPNAIDAEEASRAWSEYRSATQDVGGGFGGVRAVRRRGDDPPPEPPEHWKLRRYEFEVQFIWQPKPRSERENPDSASDATEDFAAAG